MAKQEGSLQTNGTNFAQSCYNASGAFLGIGAFTVPYGLSKGGWLSLLLLFLIAFVAFYTVILLKRCMEGGRTPVTSYHDIAQKAFGRKGRVVAYITVNLECYIFCVGLLILEGDNFHKLFPHCALHLGVLTIGTKSLFVMITALAILPSMLRTDLGILSYITAVGLFSILVVVVCVICVGAENGGVGFHGNGKALLAIGGVPTSVSLYMLCFGGHSLIPTLYASMQNKGHFTKAMAVSFSFVTLAYLSIGLVGYLMYGSEVNPQITLNLPTTNVSSKIAIYATLVIPITKYALVITPVANALQIGPFLHKGRLLRIILLFSTAVIACLFPRFEIIMAVVGSIFVVLGSVVIPCCCYLKISGVSQKRSYEYWGIIVLIVLTSLTGAIGTYSSIVQLAQDM